MHLVTHWLPHAVAKMLMSFRISRSKHRYKLSSHIVETVATRMNLTVPKHTHTHSLAFSHEWHYWFYKGHPPMPADAWHAKTSCLRSNHLQVRSLPIKPSADAGRHIFGSPNREEVQWRGQKWSRYVYSNAESTQSQTVKNYNNITIISKWSAAMIQNQQSPNIRKQHQNKVFERLLYHTALDWARKTLQIVCSEPAVTLHRRN